MFGLKQTVKPLRLSPEMKHRLLVAGITTLVGLAVAGPFLYRWWAFGTPHFSYTLGTSPDQLLPAEQVFCPGVNLSATTCDDFPGFLGVNRSAAVEHVALDPDWQAHPPRLAWRQAIGAGWSAFAVVNGFAVTMEQRGKQAQVTCYAVSSGKHQWTASWEERFTVMGVGPRSTPTIAKGHVFALGAWGHLVCLDGKTGTVIWQRELLEDLGLPWMAENQFVRFGRANSPLVIENLVIVPGGGRPDQRASLLAFDAATGEPRWRGGTRQISYSSPVLAEMLGEPQVLIVNEDALSAHAPDTGTELWSYPWPGNSSVDANVSQPVRLSSSRILLSAGYRHGAAVIELTRRSAGDPIQVRPVWRRPAVLNTKFTNVVIWKNHAYGLSDGTLECVDLANGDACWKAGRYGHGQVLRVQDVLLVLGEAGELTLVRLDAQVPNDVLGRVPALTGTTWNNLALYGRYLLIRNATEAACYELATR